MCFLIGFWWRWESTRRRREAERRSVGSSANFFWFRSNYPCTFFVRSIRIEEEIKLFSPRVVRVVITWFMGGWDHFTGRLLWRFFIHNSKSLITAESGQQTCVNFLSAGLSVIFYGISFVFLHAERFSLLSVSSRFKRVELLVLTWQITEKKELKVCQTYLLRNFRCDNCSVKSTSLHFFSSNELFSLRNGKLSSERKHFSVRSMRVLKINWKCRSFSFLPTLGMVLFSARQNEIVPTLGAMRNAHRKSRWRHVPSNQSIFVHH